MQLRLQTTYISMRVPIPCMVIYTLTQKQITYMVYAETSASSAGVNSSDYISVRITGFSNVTNLGPNYTHAWDSQSGSFSGTQEAYGYIQRSYKFAWGKASDNP